MRFVKESLIHATPERVFAFHERPDALDLLTPPWETSRVIQAAQISQVGSRAIVETRIFGPVKGRWVAEHTAYDPPRMFADMQVQGPFRSWRHQHVVEQRPDGALLRDEIDYEPPFWWFGRIAAPIVVVPRLQKLFEYRHKVTREWCEANG
jgi:ligand-binding SRPBCC domain-containing protein